MREALIIGEKAFEAELATLIPNLPAPEEGVFGPGSFTWRVDQEAALFLGAGRALLLQLAHPWVAAAIVRHSTTLTDPIGRFHRTFDVMFRLVFGSRDSAFAAARMLHRRHARVSGALDASTGAYVQGSRYAANEAHALFWVHATLVDTALRAHDLMLPPLSASERERYYAESRMLAALYGIPEAVVPRDWAAFGDYFETMLASDQIEVSQHARRIADALLMQGARFWLRPPRWYRAITTSLLTPKLRDEFALRYDQAEQARAERAIRRLRALYVRLPNRACKVGPYFEAAARLAGRDPDLLTQLSNRAWIGRARM